MKYSSPLTLSIAFSLITSSAIAQGKPSQVFKDAVAAYEKSEFERAAELFAQAYREDPNRTILFALAQSERLSDDCPSAIRHYHQLRRRKMPDEDRLRVFQGLELCGVFDNKVVEKEPVVVVENAGPTYVTKSETDWLGISLLAGGLVGMGVGTSYWLVLSGQNDDIRAADTEASHILLENRARTSRTISIVSFAGGTALLAGAAYRLLIAKGTGSKAESGDILGSGWIDSDGGGISLMGAF